jgi:hypothetical protein
MVAGTTCGLRSLLVNSREIVQFCRSVIATSQEVTAVLVNDAAEARTETFGRHRLLIVDDFYRDPDAVREGALRCDFRAGGHYPGVRAKLSNAEPGVAETLDFIRHLLPRTFAVESRTAEIVSDFALITTPPGQLSAVQKHPHADPCHIMGIVYLNPASNGGTSFYRHKQSGLDAVTDAQAAAIFAYISDPRVSSALEGYISGTNDHWERIHSVAGRFNRFVAFEGNVLHSGDVFVPDAPAQERYRLTQRFHVVIPDHEIGT